MTVTSVIKLLTDLGRPVKFLLFDSYDCVRLASCCPASLPGKK